VHRVDPEMLSRIEVVTDARRPLLAYAALVLENLVRIARPKDIVISALGVREGLLYSMLDAEERGEQSLNIIANAAFVAVDHPGRTFISLAVFFRHVGLVDEELSPRLRELVSTRVLDRARVLGAALRVAYLVSASTTGVLPKTPMVVERGRLLLRFDNGFKELAGERVFVRLRQLARLIGREPVMEAA